MVKFKNLFLFEFDRLNSENYPLSNYSDSELKYQIS